MDEYLPPLTTLEGRDAVLKAARTWGVYPTQEKGDLFIAAAEGGIREEALPLFHQWAEHLSLAWDLCNPIYEDADPVEAVEEAGVALNAWDVMGPTHRDGVLHLYGMDMLREGFTIFRTAGSPSVA